MISGIPRILGLGTRLPDGYVYAVFWAPRSENSKAGDSDRNLHWGLRGLGACLNRGSSDEPHGSGASMALPIQSPNIYLMQAWKIYVNPFATLKFQVPNI